MRRWDSTPWLIIGGFCLWGILAFTAFWVIIGVQELRYSRGSMAMQIARQADVTISITTTTLADTGLTYHIKAGTRNGYKFPKRND